MGSGTVAHEDLAAPLGRAIAESGWHVLTGGGRGTMTAALGQLLPELLLRTPLQRLEARCSIDNGASRRVLEKLGFVCEGTLRSYFVLQGRRTDHYLYALLPEDYIPVAGDV